MINLGIGNCVWRINDNGERPEQKDVTVGSSVPGQTAEGTLQGHRDAQVTTLVQCIVKTESSSLGKPLDAEERDREGGRRKRREGEGEIKDVSDEVANK